MSEREDYADLDLRPPWVLRFFFRRVLPIGILVLVVGVMVSIFIFAQTSDRHYNTHKSIYLAEKLIYACHTYSLNHPDRKYPAKLADLKEPLPGVRALLDNPDEDLVDFWGDPFRYALVPNAAGELEPHVWSERTRDGKTTLHGAKITADGTVVRFGLPGK